MANEYDRLVENLGKLQRNEGQMTEGQKKKYAAPLKKLKRQIAADASTVLRDFLVGGCRLMKRDKDSADWKAFIRETERLIDEWVKDGGNKAVAKVLFTTYSIEKFLEALLPIHYKVWYEAYGPYWLSHCTPTFEDEYTFTNDIIEMEWWAEHNEWMSVKMVDGKKEPDLAKGWTLMLPPTKELLDKDYAETMAGLEAVI